MKSHPFKAPGRILQAWLLLTPWSLTVSAFGVPPGTAFPASMTIRASVLTDSMPMAYYEEARNSEEEPFPQYQGFQPDLMRELVKIAQDLDNVTLTFELEQAPAESYDTQFEYLANDCGLASNNHTNHLVLSEADCRRLDMIIGDFYIAPERSIRTTFTPPILKSKAATIHYIHRKLVAVSTLEEAQALKEQVCLVDGSFCNRYQMESIPDLETLKCQSYNECIDWLKQEKCALFLEDEPQLLHTSKGDDSLIVTPENFNHQLIGWPLNARLDPMHQQLIVRWIYEAWKLGELDRLYYQYFTIARCPLGRAGPNCDQHCSATYGIADRNGNCICQSIRWTGADCSEEVLQDKNLLPQPLLVTCYAMGAINIFFIGVCAIWLFWNRNTAQVQVSQPFFLCLVLLGCLVSTSTIFAFVQQDDGGKADVPACMIIPWLYSVGFSITFGSIFAKIRRIYLLFDAAATMQRVSVTAKETILIVGLFLVVDVSILAVWTIVDPWEWQREVLIADKDGYALSSSGGCHSETFALFFCVLGAFHLSVMAVACYMIYVSRDIPTQFSEGKYVAIAVLSNLQIYMVCVPIVVLLGSSSEIGVFVRCMSVFLNDLAITGLIFGNLMYSVHSYETRSRSQPSSSKSMIRRAMRSFTRRRNERELGLTNRKFSAGKLKFAALLAAAAGNETDRENGNDPTRDGHTEITPGTTTGGGPGTVISTNGPSPSSTIKSLPPSSTTRWPPQAGNLGKVRSVLFDNSTPSLPSTPAQSTTTASDNSGDQEHDDVNDNTGIPRPIPTRDDSMRLGMLPRNASSKLGIPTAIPPPPPRPPFLHPVLELEGLIGMGGPTRRPTLRGKPRVSFID